MHRQLRFVLFRAYITVHQDFQSGIVWGLNNGRIPQLYLKMICMDNHDSLQFWILIAPGRPRHRTSSSALRTGCRGPSNEGPAFWTRLKAPCRAAAPPKTTLPTLLMVIIIIRVIIDIIIFGIVQLTDYHIWEFLLLVEGVILSLAHPSSRTPGLMYICISY